ncbi:MAG TPA: HAMP domain-containing sensor histidine kinase [Bacillota bacterium]|nr:HAMP domain-containing sensor histidine kinase [Bacillota bacterium]
MAEIINLSLESLTPTIQEKNITVEKRLENSFVFCDPVHLREVIVNIFNNAIDAMNNGGRLAVELSTKSRYTKIIIKDSGIGIAKENLPYILNPFFTTKNLNYNYGLGLSYCYKVLQKHGGTLEISSIEKQGTVVTLTIPNRKRRPWILQKSKAKSASV